MGLCNQGLSTKCVSTEKARVAQHKRDASTIAQMGEIRICAPTYKRKRVVYLSHVCYVCMNRDEAHTTVIQDEQWYAMWLDAIAIA
jgi:hypothetical protein